MKSEPIEIDGSYLEGGGQIARTSVALSAVTGRPCKIFNIRKGRPKPGLKAQHMQGIVALQQLCDAKVRGLALGSQELEFFPGKIRSGRLSVDVGTAGSITLVLQTLVPAALHAEGEVALEIAGGTDVAWSPSTNYFQHVFCDFLKRMGAELRIETARHGFYPKGGGKAVVEVLPCKKLRPLFLEQRSGSGRIDARSIVSDVLKERKVAERQLMGFRKVLKPDMEFIDYLETASPGSSMQAHVHFANCKLGAGALGERGRPAESVGEECALLLKKQLDSGACLDRWMADQILPYLALAGGGKVSVAEVTGHCLTNCWAIEKFLPVKFGVEGRKGKPGIISVTRS